VTVLGIDPGLASTGWGLVSQKSGSMRMKEYGVIATASDRTLADRICSIAETVSELIEVYKPDAVSIEEIFFIRNVSSGIPVAKVIGAVLLTARQHGVDAELFTPLQIKSALTGMGRADKSQVERMVMLLLGIREKIRPDHASDALAAAVCYLHTYMGNKGLRKDNNTGPGRSVL